MKITSLTILVSLLVSCSGAAQSPIGSLEVGVTVPAATEPSELPSPSGIDVSGTIATATETGELPAILPGRSTFHVTDPTTVSLASGRVQLVEFFAYWCAVCKAMAPTVHGLEDIYSSDVNFVYLDRDDPATQPIRDQLGYIYQPHFFLIDAQGAILAQWRGYVEGETLQAAIVTALDSQ
jgi:thiol-disulfide isomerase/thioredoxin